MLNLKCEGKNLIARVVESHDTFGEELADGDTKFTKIVLAKSVSIPANGLKEFGLDCLRDRDIEDGIPSRIERLDDRLSRKLLVVVCENKKLSTLEINTRLRGVTGSLVPLLSFA